MANFYRQLPRRPAQLESTSVEITGPITVSNEVEVKNDVGNPIPVEATNFDIRDLQFAQDKVDVTGSIISLVPKNDAVYYNEVLSVASGVQTTVLTKNILVDSKLKLAEFSGSNIAEFELVLNGNVVGKKRTGFTSFNDSFLFSNGLSLTIGDILLIRALHSRPSQGDFNAKFVVEE